MSNKHDIQEIIKEANNIAPQHRTSVKLGTMLRILTILEGWNEQHTSDKEVKRLNTVIQQLTKEHARLIAIIRSQDKEILRLSNIIHTKESKAK